MTHQSSTDGTNSAYFDLSGQNRAPDSSTPDNVRVVVVQSGSVVLQTASETSEPFDFSDKACVRDLVTKLQCARIQKLFYRVSDESTAPEFEQQLRRGGIDPVVLESSEDTATTADDFMDAADSEAVAERLRALGYL